MSAAADLAALASDVRARVPSLDAVMPDDDERSESPLEAAIAYADRVARASFGAALLAAVVLTLAADIVFANLWHVVIEPNAKHYDWFSVIQPGGWLVDWMEPVDTVWHAFATVAFAIIAAAIARRRAWRALEIATESSAMLDALYQHSRRAEAWLIGWWSAGLAAFGVFSCATIAFHVNGAPLRVAWTRLFTPRAFMWTAHNEAVQSARFSELCIAVSVAMLASAYLAYRRPSWLARRVVFWPAAIAATVVLSLGFAYGDLCIERFPTFARETCLFVIVLVGGVFATTLAACSFAMQRRGGR